VIVAERANELQSCASETNLKFPAAQLGPAQISPAQLPPAQLLPSQSDEQSLMPEVGPSFAGTLLNIGGGGVGLRISPDDSQILNRHKTFWMRIALMPAQGVDPASFSPICATGKLVHTHMESSHDTYAGMAFDFTFNPAHQKFVVDQICRYVAYQQKAQLQKAG
jgi:hypothetical protein